MKNLVLLRSWSHRTPLAASCWSVAHDSIYTVAVNGARKICTSQVGSATGDICSREIDVSDDLLLRPSAKIISTQFVPGEGSLVAVLSSGEVIELREAAKPCRVIGSFSDGILAAEWSPDHELLALVTGGHSCVLMTRDFEVVWEKSLHDTNPAPQHKFVDVGWGKKETQFHGSAGKQAALCKETAPPSRLSPHDNGHPAISWRGDAAYFSLSFVQPGDPSCRRIWTFGRNGDLHSINEPTHQLESCLAWRPSGTVLASTHLHQSGTHQVVFFELNGLRHGEFSLPSVRPIKSLHWNCDSALLLLEYVDGIIQLWTCSNYHWYLKYQMEFGSTLRSVAWDPGLSHRLLVCTTHSEIHIYEFCWSHFRSSCDSADEINMVAVVDGRRVLLTPFGLANVPPPMSLGSLDATKVPTCVAMFVHKNTCRLVTLSWKGHVRVYNVLIQDKKMAISFLAEYHEAIQSPLEAVMTSIDHIYIRCCFEPHLVHLKVTASGLVSVESSVDRKIGRIGKTATNRLLLQDFAGEVFVERDGHFEPLSVLPGCFLPWMSFPDACDAPFFMGLDQTGNLFIDGEKILSNCTSAFCTPSFLIACTANGKLEFYPLAIPHEQWLGLDRTGEEPTRSTEMGADIVVGVSSSSSLVLQMPRGNLETIYPRAMVLARIRHYLSGLEYLEAYLLCRRHRIDLNVIHNVNPKMFIATIGKFVVQVNKPEYLNLFLTSLRPENVVATKYSGFGLEPAESMFESDERVNLICRLVREAVAADPVKYVETLMTSFVAQSPPDYESALTSILELSHVPDEVVDKSLKYLIFLVDADKLFNVALGMHELPLALSIGRRSQKDPKEYVPLLEEFFALELPFRLFRIDDHLGNHEKALVHLVAAERPFREEIMEYVRKNRLFKSALKMYREPHHPEERHALLLEYGESLVEDHCEEAAMSLFKMANNHERVLNLALKLGHWQNAVVAATKLGCSDTQIESLSEKLVGLLLEQKRYSEAWLLAKIHVKKKETLCKVVVEGHLWQNGDFDEQGIVVGGALKALSRQMEDLQAIRTELVAKCDRLEELLSSAPPTCPVGDVSDVSSELSIASRTTTTHKSKKKADRQRTKGKRGSPYEREFLRDGIKALLVRSTGTMCDSLMRFLYEKGFWEEASELKSSYEDLNGLIQARLSNLKKLENTFPIEEQMVWKTAFDLPANFPLQFPIFL